MITKVNPRHLMGKIENDGTFYRINQKSENEHQDKILRYGCGLYFVFNTKSTSFKIRYKCHFKEAPIRFSKKQMVECSIMGYEKSTGNWYYLNSLNGFKPINGKSDDFFEPDIAIVNRYDKYQVCLPENGVSYDYEIESDLPIEFEYIPNEIILTGSSIGQFCNDCNHMNLCAYMYREYGINVATVAISEYHTFSNSMLMETLDKYKERMIVVADLEHCHHSDYNRVKAHIGNLVFLVIDSLITKTCKQLKEVHPEIESFQPVGSWMCDSRHLNDYGIVEYSKKIIEKYNEYKGYTIK